MAAYTDSLGFNKGTAAFPSDVTSISKFVVELDFAAIIAARSAAGATALAATGIPVQRVGDCAGLNYIEGAMHGGNAAGRTV